MRSVKQETKCWDEKYGRRVTGYPPKGNVENWDIFKCTVIQLKFQ